MKHQSLIILANENSTDHQQWVEACNGHKEGIIYKIVNLSSSDWLNEIKRCDADYFLSRPPGLSSVFKQLYDERLYIIANVLQKPVYPSLEECLIYENKRFLYTWLAAQKIPHPNTNIFYNINEGEKFIKDSHFPLVAKTNIGASGSGVTILYSEKDAIKYLRRVFFGNGAPKRWGPNFSKGGLLKRGFQYVIHPNFIFQKINIYKKKRLEVQKDFVIFQEFISHDFEWRVVRIGDSFFAHKKLKTGEKSSGSLIKGYENPPLKLLDFVKGITDKHHFYSQAIDIFEDNEREYLVNEMQCIFGQSDPFQMLVGGKKGRYRFLEKKWIFEEGDFARNACFDLRLEYVLSKMRSV